jgi:hypothetical protein
MSNIPVYLSFEKLIKEDDTSHYYVSDMFEDNFMNKTTLRHFKENFDPIKDFGFDVGTTILKEICDAVFEVFEDTEYKKFQEHREKYDIHPFTNKINEIIYNVINKYKNDINASLMHH